MKSWIVGMADRFFEKNKFLCNKFMLKYCTE